MSNFTKEDVEKIFDTLDQDKSGRLSRSEIAAMLTKINVEPTRIELDVIFKEIDKDSSGSISKEELTNYLTGPPPAARTTIKALTEAFQVYDTDKDGSITFEELKDVVKKTTGIDDQELIQAMFDLADKNKSGLISFQEFVKMMKDEH